MCTPGMRFGMSLRYDPSVVVVPSGETVRIAGRRNERARLVVAMIGDLTLTNQILPGIGPLLNGVIHPVATLQIQLGFVVLDRERLGDVLIQELYVKNVSSVALTFYVTDIFMTTYGDM